LRDELELLDPERILKQLDRDTRRALAGLVVEGLLDSTNSAVRKLPPGRQHATAVLAEHQSAGRGRRGRQWHSPFGGNLYLSLGWSFEKPLAQLACLPLVLALAVAEALARAGLRGHAVKWPNDLVLGQRKLSGCLVEMQGEAAGPCRAVLGVGINVRMPTAAAAPAIDQPWTDIASSLPGCSRNQLAALLLDVLFAYLPRFGHGGFAPFMPLWEQHDVLRGRAIELTTRDGGLRGVACGIDVHGSLLLDTGDGLRSLRSGEVSVQSGWAR
jgi:BirA family biotin operon repressor/biotin-[acetyl-CoA-carboxylase] ligase